MEREGFDEDTVSSVRERVNTQLEILAGELIEAQEYRIRMEMIEDEIHQRIVLEVQQRMFEAGFPNEDDAAMDASEVYYASIEAELSDVPDATYDPNTEARLMNDESEHWAKVNCGACPNCLQLKAVNPNGFTD